MGKLKESLEKYNRVLEINKQDILRVSKLSQESLDGLKFAYWEFTETLFEDYKKVGSGVWDKFLKVLRVKEDSSINFNEIKNRMSAFQASEIYNGEADELFLVYNNKDSLKKVESAELLVDWMSCALECKVYKQKIQILKKKQPKIVEKAQHKLERISKLSKTREKLLQNLSDLEKYLKFQRINLNTSSLAGSLKNKSGSITSSDSKTIKKIEDFFEIQISTNDYYREPTIIKNFQRIPFMFEKDQELRCCKIKYFCC